MYVRIEPTVLHELSIKAQNDRSAKRVAMRAAR